MFYQDPLIGLFDEQIKGLGLKQYYNELIDTLKSHLKDNQHYHDLFSYYIHLAKVLSQKSELGLELKAAYDEQDKRRLDELANQVIPQCIHDIEQLKLFSKEIIPSFRA